MSFQFLAVHLKLVFRICEFAEQLLHLVLFFAVFCHEVIILAHESLVFASLVGIKFVKSHLHLLMNACQFILKNFGFFFNFFSLQKYFIKFRLELIILIFNVLIGYFNIFWSGINSKFVQGQVIISQLTFEASDLSGKGLKSFFELIIKLLFFVDGFGFISQFLGFFLDVHHLLFDFGDVVISVVYFSLSWYTLGTIDTTAGSQWALLDLNSGTDSTERIQSLNYWRFTLMAVPCLETAPCWAPNLGLMEVPAREPIDILLRFGSMILKNLNNFVCICEMFQF